MVSATSRRRSAGATDGAAARGVSHGSDMKAKGGVSHGGDMKAEGGAPLRGVWESSRGDPRALWVVNQSATPTSGPKETNR